MHPRSHTASRLLLSAVLALPVLSSFTPAQIVQYGCDADQVLNSVDAADHDHMGQSIAAGGDFNGDEIRDFVVGGYKRNADQGETRVFVFLGTGNAPSASPFFRHRLTISASSDDTQYDLFGWSVAFIGDLNNDGCDELAIGAPRFDGPSMSESGRVWIVFGEPSLDPSDPHSAAVATSLSHLVIDGTVDGGWFGGALATAQDSSGHHLQDLLVGAPGEGPADSTSVKGSVYLIGAPTVQTAGVLVGSVPGVVIAASPLTPGTPGIAGSLSIGFTLTAHRLLQGDTAGDGFGFAVAFVGNVDGEAGQEFLVGAPQYSPEHDGFVTTGPGYARLFRMGSSTPLITIPGTQQPGESPRREGEACGFAVAGAVQLNHIDDEIPDLLIGSPLFTVDAGSLGGGLVQAGRVRAFSGAAAALGIATPLLAAAAPNGTVMVGIHAADQFGNAVVGVHDFDGDDVDDVLVGAWNANIAIGNHCVTSANPHRTSQGGSASLFSAGSSVPGTPPVVFDGERYRDHLGRAVAAMDLFGSSSKPEFILAGIAWTPVGQEAPDPTELGRIYVWNGDTVLIP